MWHPWKKTYVDEGIDTEDGKVCLRKQRAKRRKILVSEQLQDFASNTTLHGLGYIARRGLTTVEKIFWLITFCASISICIYQINNVWSKWQDSPIIVSINEELIPVSEMPFPSVTICPQSKVFTYGYNYTEIKADLYDRCHIKKLNCTDNEDVFMFEDVSLLCDQDLPYKQLLNLSDRYYSNIAVVEHLREVTESYIKYWKQDAICTWQKKEDKECDMLKVVYTKEGICFNFNGMAANDIFRKEEIQEEYSYTENKERRKGWSIENGYHDGSTIHPYPRRGRQNGANPDLVLLFRDNREFLVEECNAIHSGYKIYVHHPADMPQSSLFYYALLPEEISSFALKYSVVSTSPKLRDYSVDVRRCYFADERYLRYFQIYTENNCRMECLSNYTYSMCGCVGFYMPHHTTDRICTLRSTACMETALEELAEKETPDIRMDPNRCNCLPLCNNVEYEAEIIKNDLTVKNYLITSLNASLNEDDSFSRLEMFFKSPRFVSMRRSELFGTTDFIANCGGLLGLFLGFSFLSLVEIIYFMTLRLWCTFKRDLDLEGKQNK